MDVSSLVRPLAVRFFRGQFFEGRQHRSVQELLEKGKKVATEQLLSALCLEKIVDERSMDSFPLAFSMWMMFLLLAFCWPEVFH